MEETKIIAKVRQGNANAFSCLVEKYQSMAFSIALRILRNKEDAEDVVQEAFLKTYRSLSSFRGEAKFSTWFYRIVYHAALNKCRSPIKWVNYEIEASEADVDFSEECGVLQTMASDDRKRIVQQVLDAMLPEESLLLNLYYFQECTIAEIAQITDLNESHVKVKLFRIRRIFYEKLKTYVTSEMSILL